MGESCANNPRDCPLLPRVEVLEKLQEANSVTHKEIFRRLNDVEKENVAQEGKYNTLCQKLDGLDQRIDDKLTRLSQDLDSKFSDLGARIDGVSNKSDSGLNKANSEIDALKAEPGQHWKEIMKSILTSIGPAFILWVALGMPGIR